jgi:3-deoxy-manno-octulosonate cytidylyltransferase (CMP-KDO synthetase)
MKTIAIIPARYHSTRLPAKLMQDLGGKTVILTTYQAVEQSKIFDEICVATDSDVIYQEIISNGGNAVMSKKNHESGSDRIAEASQQSDAEIVVNIQGDEPFIDSDSLKKLIEIFKNDLQNEIQVASLMTEITDFETINNPNNVKVVVDSENIALYFSRSPIPFVRDKNDSAIFYKHIGVYAFRKNALQEFTLLPIKPLENTEKLEQLRYLEYGKKIKMIVTNHQGIGIDTQEDLDKARLFLERIKF